MKLTKTIEVEVLLPAFYKSEFETTFLGIFEDGAYMVSNDKVVSISETVAKDLVRSNVNIPCDSEDFKKKFNEFILNNDMLENKIKSELNKIQE